MSKETEPRITFERSAAIFMVLVCAISLLAVTGWLFNQPILASLRPEYIPMAPASALIFLGLIGVWIAQIVFPARHEIKILVQAGLLGMLIIVLVLTIRYFTGLGPDLEQLLYPNPTLFGQILTAHMSPLSALGFFLAIPAFLLMTGAEPDMRLKNTAASLALIVFILSSLNILGYLYGAPLFYGGTIIPVAITTALSFWFLSLGLLMTAGPVCWPTRVFVGPSLKARLMRAFIPTSILIVLIQGLLSRDPAPLITNPAIRVALAALVSLLIVILIISLIANNLSTEIERSNQARIRAESTLKQSEAFLNENEAKYRSLVDEVSDGFYISDPYRKLTFANRALARILGFEHPEAVIGHSFLEFVPPEKSGDLSEQYQAALTTGKNSSLVTTEVIRQDGSKAFVEIRPQVIVEAGRPVGNRGMLSDITERKRNELIQNAIYRITQTAITSDRIETLYHSIHSILGELIPTENFYIALYDPVNELISFPYYVDQYDEPPTGATPLQGLTGYVIRNGRPLLATREIFDRLIGQGEVQAVGTVGVDWMGAPLKAEGRMIGVMAVQSYTEGIHFGQEDLNLLEFVSTQVAQAIERKRMEEEIRSLSLIDELTGLYNRRGFTLLAEQEVKLAYRIKRSMLLFFGDVDDLKVINDTHAHVQGDLALKEVSAILKEIFREADIAARFGGDEFVVLAVDASIESADILVNRIQAALEKRNQEGSRPYQLTLSVGITRFDPEAPCTLNELIAQADSLMYHHKKSGKGEK